MGKPAKMSHAVSQERTRNYVRQIKGSVVFKGLAVATSFFAIPLMIHYLGQEQFGVWSTILSVLSWIVFFDLGLGNGLRNKLAESIAKNEIAEAARYISYAYSLIGLISISSLALMTIATFVIPWQRVFNTQSVTEATLRYTVLIAAVFIFLNFWISLINQVLNAIQKTSVVVFGQFLSNALSLALVFTLTKTTDSSILYLAAVYGVSLVTSNVLLSIWFYRQSRGLIPSFSLDSQRIRPLLSLGLQFFTIQFAVLVIFTTDKMLITQLFGPQYVTQYDVVFKLFSMITLIHSLITAPLWSSYTDAYHRGDFAWIKGILRKQLMIFGMIVLSVIILTPMAKPIIALWIGNDIEVSMPLVISMGAFVLVSTWNNIFGFVLGGISKIRLGSFYTIVTAVLNIPLSYFFAIKLDIGIAGIMLGTVVSICISVIVSPIQVYYFIYTGQNNKFLSSVLK
ncbi:MAG: oligosaccharide flippase family protein [Parcubacteria group bacterium]